LQLALVVLDGIHVLFRDAVEGDCAVVIVACSPAVRAWVLRLLSSVVMVTVAVYVINF
jgi:hypothetical protein